jgi:hypothetical protein
MCTVLVQGKSGEKMAGVRPQLKVAVYLFRTTQGSRYTTLDVETGNALYRAIWNNNGSAKHTPSTLAEVKTTLSRKKKAEYERPSHDAKSGCERGLR